MEQVRDLIENNRQNQEGKIDFCIRRMEDIDEILQGERQRRARDKSDMDMEVQRCISSTQSVAEQFDVIKLSVQAISELTACMIESLRISNSL